jgi:hypothetical protein
MPLLRATRKLHQSNSIRNDGWYTDHKDQKPDTHFHQARTKAWGERWQEHSCSNLPPANQGYSKDLQQTAFSMIFMTTSIRRTALGLPPRQHQLNQGLDGRGIIVSFPYQG